MKFVIDKCCIQHVPEISWYNHNYYRLNSYGDWLCIYMPLYIFEECFEDENCYTDTLGYFQEGEFISILSCTNSESIIKGNTK